MFFLSDYTTSEYARRKGSSDKLPSWRRKLRRLRKSIWNPNTANAAAVGAQLGGTIGLLSSNPKNTFKRTLIGTGVGLAAGTGMGIQSSYRNQRKY